MLNLTRRIGETIRIADSIAVTVREVKGRQVRIGIEAPREELVDRKIQPKNQDHLPGQQDSSYTQLQLNPATVPER